MKGGEEEGEEEGGEVEPYVEKSPMSVVWPRGCGGGGGWGGETCPSHSKLACIWCPLSGSGCVCGGGGGGSSRGMRGIGVTVGCAFCSDTPWCIVAAAESQVKFT